MLDYFSTVKEAFNWRCKLGLKPLLIFMFKSVLAYIFLVGFYIVGFQILVRTPLMHYMSVENILNITKYTTLVIIIVVSVPVGLHILKFLIGCITSNHK
ncbi:Uncharacterised protein [Pragia fontium]|nr:Uncharacterised protein [Pragia fontium]